MYLRDCTRIVSGHFDLFRLMPRVEGLATRKANSSHSF